MDLLVDGRVLGSVATMHDGARSTPSIVSFGDFQLDSRSRELRKRGRILRLQQQPFEILSRLVGADGDLVTRQELRDAVWEPDTHVDFDRAINKAVSQLRQVLGDSVGRPRFIETLSKRGYRFLFPVVRAASHSRIPPEAREALLKARHFWNKRTAQDIVRSIDYFRKALEVDAEYPAAWAGLAEAYVMTGVFGLEPPQRAFPAAKSAAERALMLDDSVAEAHTALGDVHKLYEWDWWRAECAYRRAIDVDPHYAGAHHWYAQLLAILARDDEALVEIEAARRCDPVSIPVNAFVAYVWLEERQYGRAIRAALDARELDAGAPLPYLFLGRAYAKCGDYRQAIGALTQGARLAGDVPLFEANLAYAYARSGQRGKADRRLERFVRGHHKRVVSPIDIALVCLGLGETEAALDALEDAFSARSARMINLNDPFFSELSGEARYQQLLARMGLPSRDS